MESLEGAEPRPPAMTVFFYLIRARGYLIINVYAAPAANTAIIK